MERFDVPDTVVMDIACLIDVFLRIRDDRARRAVLSYAAFLAEKTKA